MGEYGAVLADRCRRWNERYHWLALQLEGVANLRLAQRPPQEQAVPNPERILTGLCDTRLSLMLTQADCGAIAAVTRDAMVLARA